MTHLRYRCLVLDHDDTVMNSSIETNYPNMIDTLAHLRPAEKLSLEEFIEGNNLGFDNWVRQRYRFTPQELDWQYQNWREHVMQKRPSMVKGMAAFLADYRSAGGIICAATHSFREMIVADYSANCGFLPDYINCWDDPPLHRQPNPWPVEDAMRRFDLQQSDILVVDDLRPGHLMAQTAGVDAAAAFWCCTTPSIEGELKATARYCFYKVEELRQLILG